MREVEIKVFNERVRDKEVSECGADGGRCSVPATEVARGEAGEADVEELDDGFVGGDVGGRLGDADVSQRFAGRVEGGKYERFQFECAWGINE